MKKTGTKARSSSEDWKARTVFIVVAVVLSGAMIYMFMINRPPDFYLKVELSDLPLGFDKAFIVTADVEVPLQDREALSGFVDGFNAVGVTPTIFVRVSESSEKAMDDIDFLSTLNATFGVLAPDDFASRSFDEQESLLWSAKDALKPLNVTGLRSYTASYDTLLVAENSFMDHFSSFLNLRGPERPESVVGGKMRVLMFSISADPSNLPPLAEVWTVDLPVKPGIEKEFSSIIKNDSIIKWSLDDATAFINDKDKMGVEISTDMSSLVSTVQVSILRENSTVLLTSSLPVANVTSGNESIRFSSDGSVVRIPMKGVPRIFQVKWEK